MKRVSFFSFLMVFFVLTPVKSYAQSEFNELKKGYVITQGMDTLYGLLSSYGQMVTPQECVLQSVCNGVETTTTYKPTDIYGFRFDDGKFFVSREVSLDEGVQIVFLEYLVDGIVSAFFYDSPLEQVYFMEDERGKMLPMLSKVKIFVQKGVTYKSVDTKYIGMLKVAFQKSPKILKKVEKFPLNQESLIKLTTEYHAEVCETGQVCIVYEKDYQTVTKNTKKYRKDRLQYNFLHTFSLGVQGSFDWYHPNYHYGQPIDNLYYFENKSWSNPMYGSGGIFLELVMKNRSKLRYENLLGGWTISSYKHYAATETVTRNQIVDESLFRIPFYNEISFKYLSWNKDNLNLFVGVGVYVIPYLKSDYQMNRSTYYSYNPDNLFNNQTSTVDLFGLCDYGGTVGVQLEYLFHRIGKVQIDLKYKAGVSSERNSTAIPLSVYFEEEPPLITRFAQGVNLTIGVGLYNLYQLKK